MSSVDLEAPNISADITDIFLIQEHLAFDVIIGCQSIQDWNLFSLIPAALRSQETPLSAILSSRRPRSASDATHVSLTSAQAFASDAADLIKTFDDSHSITLGSLQESEVDDFPPATLDPSTFAPLTSSNLASLPDSTPPDPIALHSVSSFEFDDLDSLASWQATQESIPIPSSFSLQDAPPEAIAIFDDKFNSLLNPDLANQDRDLLRKVLYPYQHIFADTLDPFKASKIPPMDLELKPGVEIPKAMRGRPRRVSQAQDDEIHTNVAKLTSLGLASTILTCGFYSQVLLASRKILDATGTQVVKTRFCIDYRLLNLITLAYYWPLPLIDDILRRLSGNSVFSTLDLTMGFNQVRLTERAQELTTFITSRGLYQYTRVPFGLKGGPSYFQRMLQDVVLKDLCNVICMIYIDDIIIFGRNHEEHADNLRRVLQRLAEFDITVKTGKCLFGSSRVKYLGHQVDRSGISISEDRLLHIKSLRLPETVAELHALVGVAGFFRQHLEHLSEITAPLYAWLQKSNRTKIQWTEETTMAFNALKQAILDAPILKFLEPEGPISLYTDASDVALGGHLIQTVAGSANTICFVSKKFNPTQQRWSVTERELYAIVYSILKLRAMLGGRQFTVHTDHKTLSYWNSDNDTPKVYRWKQRLTEFDFIVVHEPGISNCVADVLSRLTQPYKKATPLTTKSIYGNSVSLPLLPEDLTPTPLHASLPATSSQLDCIKSFHNDDVGHLNTYQRMRIAGHKWPHMLTHVKHYISLCNQCQHSNPLLKPHHGSKFLLVTSTPFEVVYVDSLGPRDNDSSFKHIIVFIDGMTRFVRLYPLPDLTAETVRPIFSSYCHQFRPTKLYFDNHKQFNNALIFDLLKELSIESVQSTPYSHQENGLVERTIQTASRHITNWTLLHPAKNWSSYLPTVEAILNENPIPGTNFTPYQAVFGSLAAQRRLSPTVEELVKSTDDILHEVIAAHDTAVTSKQDLIAHANEHFDRKTFTPGSKVLITNQTRTKQFHSLPYIGPFTVIAQDFNTLSVSDLRTSGTIRKVHIKHVKKLPSDYVETISVPSNYFEVEAILSHRSTSKRNIILLVKWAGFDDPSEEHLSKNPSLKKTSAFQAYLILHPEIA